MMMMMMMMMMMIHSSCSNRGNNKIIRVMRMQINRAMKLHKLHQLELYLVTQNHDLVIPIL